MSDISTQSTPEAPAGTFDAEGRTVAAGRGWDWIADAFGLFRKQPGIWILIALLGGILCIVISMVPILGSIANALLVPIFGAGIMLGCKAQDEGGTLEVAHLFAGFKQRTGDLVLVGAFNLAGWLVIGIAVFAVVGGGVFMGVVRGGAPGAGISIVSMLIAALIALGLSVPLYMASWFAPVLIVLHQLAPVAALKASFNACMRNWIPFSVYGIVLLVLCIVAAIPAGLGLLILFPVLAASVYTAYRDIFCAARQS